MIRAILRAVAQLVSAILLVLGVWAMCLIFVAAASTK